MITFIQFLITGLRLGSVYALIALGYTMVYGIIKLINFAHGDFIMVGGYSLFFTIPVLMGMGLPGWLSSRRSSSVPWWAFWWSFWPTAPSERPVTT